MNIFLKIIMVIKLNRSMEVMLEVIMKKAMKAVKHMIFVVPMMTNKKTQKIIVKVAIIQLQSVRHSINVIM